MNQQIIERAMHRMRLEALMQRIFNGLHETIQLRSYNPDVNVDEVRVDFTNKSAEFIVPLVEAVDILEAIIFASDGCMGHRQCVHSMEPWQRARALLQGKWEAETERRNWP